MDSIYVLELEHFKYFIINTTSSKRKHLVYLPDSYTMTDVVAFFENYPNKWLQLHKPISVISKLPGDEEEFYRQLADWTKKKGFENVKGSLDIFGRDDMSYEI